jgi:hypothetical protein
MFAVNNSFLFLFSKWYMDNYSTRPSQKPIKDSLSTSGPNKSRDFVEKKEL